MPLISLHALANSIHNFTPHSTLCLFFYFSILCPLFYIPFILG